MKRGDKADKYPFIGAIPQGDSFTAINKVYSKSSKFFLEKDSNKLQDKMATIALYGSTGYGFEKHIGEKEINVSQFFNKVREPITVSLEATLTGSKLPNN